MVNSRIKLLAAVLIALLTAACATQQRADIRINSAPDADLSAYVETVTYPVGTANIDVVDAKRRQLIWEGVARGRISDHEMEHPREIIATAVAELFSRFPGRARAVDAAAPSAAH